MHSSIKPENDPRFVLPYSDQIPAVGVLFVDPFSDFHSGYMIDVTVHFYQAGVVRVISPYQAKGLNQTNEEEDCFQYTAPLNSPDLKIWLEKIPFPITAVICESDSGLDYAERLADAIEKVQQQQQKSKTLKHNGYNSARRDKFLMNQLCKERGVETVKQITCESVKDALAEAASTFGCTRDIKSSIPVIIKPKRSVASDKVVLCQTLDDIPKATQTILDSYVFGEWDVRHGAVLMQEYVTGSEYAIDMVSKDGVHKAAAVWLYEKTCTSDEGTQPFAYLSGRLVQDENCEKILEYVRSCLDALNIAWGMTHTEIKLEENGKIRLIEVNVRQQNDHFGPICDACIGYNAMSMCLSAYLDDDEDSLFESVPIQPALEKDGMIVNLACFVEGKIQKISHLKEIDQLESVVAIELFPGFGIGDIVTKTKDIRSDCGWVHLINNDKDCIERDYQQICKCMKTMFQVE